MGLRPTCCLCERSVGVNVRTLAQVHVKLKLRRKHLDSFTFRWFCLTSQHLYTQEAENNKLLTMTYCAVCASRPVIVYSTQTASTWVCVHPYTCARTHISIYIYIQIHTWTLYTYIHYLYLSVYVWMSPIAIHNSPVINIRMIYMYVFEMRVSGENSQLLSRIKWCALHCEMVHRFWHRADICLQAAACSRPTCCASSERERLNDAGRR